MKPNHKALFPIMAATGVIVLLISCIISYRTFHKNYHGIALKNATCRIPIRMWCPDEDAVKVTDHLFSIVDDESEYIIFGCQFDSVNNDDLEYIPFPVVFDTRFLEYDSLGELENLLKSNTEILKIVTDAGKYIRPSFEQYYISGTPQDQYSGYETYVVAMNEEDMRFVEIILYKDSVELTNKEKEDIFKCCNYSSSYR